MRQVIEGVDFAVEAGDVGLEGEGLGFLFIEVGHPLGFIGQTQLYLGLA